MKGALGRVLVAGALALSLLPALIGAALASPPVSPTTPAADGLHVDLPQGKRTWTQPEDLAEGALVHIETVAHVEVALSGAHLEWYRWDVRDHRTDATGTYINTRRSVVTSASAVQLGNAQRDRFGIWAVNSAFVREGLLRPAPADAFSPTRISGDQAADDRLQDCYRFDAPSSGCAVIITMGIRVFPSIAGAAPDGIPAQRQVEDDPNVAVLDLGADPDRTPLTLQLSNPVAGEQFKIVTSNGANQDAEITAGTLTDDPQAPVPSSVLAGWFDRVGVRGAGSPVVSEHGDLIGILGIRSGDQGFQVTNGSQVAASTARFGVPRNSSAADADFRDGLDLFEHQRFSDAMPRLRDAVDQTGGQFAAKTLLALAGAKQDGPEDLSDEAEAGAPAPEDPTPWNLPAAGIFGGLVLLVAAAGVFGWFHQRRSRDHRSAAAAVPASDGDDVTMRRHVPVGASGPRRDGPTTKFAVPGTGAATSPAAGSGPPASTAVPGSFCRSCGSQLAPGDRFCFSCGAPAKAT